MIDPCPLFFVVSLKKAVCHTVLLIRDDRIQIDIFHTSENIFLYDTDLSFLIPAISFLTSIRLESELPSAVAGGAGVGKPTGTLDKMQSVIIPPVLDVVLADQIHRADQFHALEIGAVQLWHHGLHLCAIEHSHKDRLDHIVIVMSQRDLVAAQFLCLAVQIAPCASSRTDNTAISRYRRPPQKYSSRRS